MRHYRVGLMVGNKSIDYVHAIRMGIQNTLEEEGHTLIAVSDLIPFHSRSNAQAYFRVAFEVAGRLDLDAIIVPAGVIAGYLTSDQDSLSEFLGILDPKKTLVIEREIPGYRCISKDNAQGMRECMHHLIEDCGFTRIAFIGGPETSMGAREREDIYFEEMAAHGLDTPPSLLARGELSGECGTAIEDLIDDNHDLEAIACCCDLIAHSVYKVMHKRRLTVGADIAVTGFDDDEMSAHMDPPLSTVHMTGYDLGCMAAREALRICEGKAQEESVLSSTFIARTSCGEDVHTGQKLYSALLAERPFPTEKVVSELVASTLTMGGKRATDHFASAMKAFVKKVVASYRNHIAQPDEDDQLFSTQDIGLLFIQDYRDHLSLEGFHSVAIGLLQALLDQSVEKDRGWVIDQISLLHLGIARMLSTMMQEDKVAMGTREWTIFHMTDDAIRESTNPLYVYQLILEEFVRLGVRQADLYLLPESVAFIGTRTFALSDSLLPIGRLANNKIQIEEDAAPVAIQDVLDRLIPRNGAAPVYTVGGIMAGNELVGVAAIDSGTLDDDGQLVAFLNLGVALKHLQMIATERESNELLSRSNMLLERQSHYDEMTGVLNRRGFMSKLRRLIDLHKGAKGALFYLDLDGLKYINDTYGHDNGDEAICQTTRVLAACLPPDALMGRLGGDEFVAFVLVGGEGELTSIERSVDVGMATFNATHSYPFDLSISYGGVILDVNEGTYANINQSLVLADEKLYEMKRHRGTSRSYQDRR